MVFCHRSRSLASARTAGFRVGFYDHLGWAVAVTASRDHQVVDRRRIELLEPGLPNMPIHGPGMGQSREAVEALVARVRDSAERATAASLEALTAALPSSITSVHIRNLPADFPSDIAIQLRPPYEARADAIMYRQVLAAVARTRGWVVGFYDAKTAEADAVTILGRRADEVLRGPRDWLGPPWTKDHRTALAATILAARSEYDGR
ncbi:MAG: hypothetical protein CL878_02110 [Dehalococcoidia bacterium]|nr:hypothetical protein [Dehalococcoidia bacterium]